MVCDSKQSRTKINNFFFEKKPDTLILTLITHLLKSIMLKDLIHISNNGGLQIKNYIEKNNNYELYRKIPTYEDALLQLDFFPIYNLIINKDLSFENGFD